MSLTRAGEERWFDSYKGVAVVWLASRGALALTAVWAMASYHLTFGTVVGRWDALHFYTIAYGGYTDPSEVAFFPGLPALLRFFAALGIPMSVSGVVLSLVASGFAAAALYKLVGGLAACLWLLAPTAVFTVVPYTEALFCALAFWAWQRAAAERWWQAAGLAALACTLRVSGLFLVGALGLVAIGQAWAARGDRWLALLVRAGWLAVPLAVLAAYEVYLRIHVGTWTAWLDAEQAGWSRTFTWPWDALRHTLSAASTASWPGRPEVPWVFRAEIVSMGLGVLACATAACRRRWADLGWVGVQVAAFATTYWYMSVNRAVLLWFPLFAALAAAATWRPAQPGAAAGWKVLVGMAFLANMAAMVAWAVLYFTGRWAS
jgi:hypothetical protein